MEPVSTIDAIYYLIVFVFTAFTQVGPLNVFTFFIGAIPFFLIRLPFDIFLYRVMTKFEDRNPFNRRSSLSEYISYRIFSWVIQKVEPNTIGKVFFSESLSKMLYSFRTFRNGSTGQADVSIEEVNEDLYNAIWIRSTTRGKENDLVIYYIHGGGFSMASVHFYTEYFVDMLNGLYQQGFRNPAIFAIDYRAAPQAKFSQQMEQIISAWEHLTASFYTSQLVLAGDSNGATLALSLLLHIARPYPSIKLCNPAKKPAGAILISPWTDLFYKTNNSRSDYLTQRTLVKYALSYIDENQRKSDVHHNPGLCRSREWWTRAFPEHGIYITYGAEEILANEIQEFYSIVRQCGNIRVESEPDQIHSWPIIMHYLGRTEEERMRGVQVFCRNLANMILWSTSTDPKRMDNIE